MSSGYSSSAIRERIYFGDDMSGVLLYTGSADKEGSLGGLVELGNIDQLIVLMKDAFQEALVCTNDPEWRGVPFLLYDLRNSLREWKSHVGSRTNCAY